MIRLLIDYVAALNRMEQESKTDEQLNQTTQEKDEQEQNGDN